MSVQGLDEFSRPLDPIPFLQRAGEKLQRRTYEDLKTGNFDFSLGDPAKIAHNQAYTIRRKGFDKPGFGKTGEMSIALVDPANLAIDGNALEVDLLPPNGQELKFNVFTRGQTQARRVVVLTGPKGTPRKKTEREVVVPPRDFVQVHEDGDGGLEDLAGQLEDDVWQQWGFR